ncbi:MAG TPA: ribose-phosphate pyrophosphokinase [Candidatus Polarisedimenticolia bacterium]|jgi:ribose-phosphate pyrophosphokinase|nr:ribose-phosphate pyrophosphokinase [Candidatus Polarisedimenticolia bacterium]
MTSGESVDGDLKIFTGNAHPVLAREIAENLGVALGAADVHRFADGEAYCHIQENIRGTDVFVIQPTCPPVDANLMELLVMLDAFKRSSAARVTAVMPYYGYARQDRKDKPRVPITAKLVADLLTAAGASRILAMDLHAPAIQGFFDIPVDHLFAAPVLIEHVDKMKLEDLVIVSPDAGGVERARAYAKRLDASLAIIDKRRGEKNEPQVMHVIGEVEGKNCLIVDDMVDTAGTLVGTVQALTKKGARRVYGCFTHAILSGPAVDRVRNAEMAQMVVTNSIPLEESRARAGRVTVLSVAGLLSEAIRRIHTNSSVSSLFV